MILSHHVKIDLDPNTVGRKTGTETVLCSAWCLYCLAKQHATVFGCKHAATECSSSHEVVQAEQEDDFVDSEDKYLGAEHSKSEDKWKVDNRTFFQDFIKYLK